MKINRDVWKKQQVLNIEIAHAKTPAEAAWIQANFELGQMSDFGEKELEHVDLLRLEADLAYILFLNKYIFVTNTI